MSLCMAKLFIILGYMTIISMFLFICLWIMMM